MLAEQPEKPQVPIKLICVFPDAECAGLHRRQQPAMIQFRCQQGAKAELWRRMTVLAGGLQTLAITYQKEGSMRRRLMTRHDYTVGWLGSILLWLLAVHAVAQQPAPSQMPAADPAPFAVVELFTSEG